MANDLRAKQIRTNQIIASGSINSASLFIYGADAATTLTGEYSSSLLSGVGSDVFLFISGSTNSSGTSSRGVTLAGGDFVASGTIKSNAGISGSLTRLFDGNSYLVAGTNVTITSESNGQVRISSTGGSGSPAGSDTYLQFNDGGSFGAVADLKFDKTSKILSLTGSIAATGSIFYSGSAAFGSGSLARGAYSVALGEFNLSTGRSSFSHGFGSLASGTGAHAEGLFTTASATYSHAQGFRTVSSAPYSHAEGDRTLASNATAHAEGLLTTASAFYSHAEGHGSIASGILAHAEGFFTVASGEGAHSAGTRTLASANYTVTAGLLTTASALIAHAEGNRTLASGQASHTEGGFTTASFTYAHAEGVGSIASGLASHAEGELTLAFGSSSHAQGFNAVSYGDYSFAGGIFTIASGTGQTVFGSYNIRDNTTSYLVVGNGTADSDANRSDVFRVESSGIEVTGSVYASLGLSGSLTQLHDGRSYLVAGANVTITSESNGQVFISSTGGGGSSANQWNELSPSPRLNTTASVSIAGGRGSSYAAQSAGPDVFFFVSGTIDSRGTSTAGTSVFGGDTLVSGSLYLASNTTSGYSTLANNAGTLEIRNRTLGGTFVASVNTTIGNTANFLDVRPNGMAVNTKVAILPGIYAGPASPFTSTDTNFFVGGTAGSKGGSTGGTSVFGGDLQISGSTYIGTDSSNSIYFLASVATDILPDANRVRNLGSNTLRFANMYTGDLHLQNERGDYTLIEEADCLTIRFNKTGKRYRFVLEPAPEFDEQ